MDKTKIKLCDNTEIYKELRETFVKRLTLDSSHHDERRKDFNQAIFDTEDGLACFNGTDLSMVLEKFDNAVADVTESYTQNRLDY